MDREILGYSIPDQIGSLRQFGPLTSPSETMTSPIVLKIGGSLFDLPGLAKLLWTEFERFPGQPRLLIAGGGPAADVVREWDRVHPMPPQVSHALAVHSMSLTARFTATLLPQAQLVTTMAQARSAWAVQSEAILILDAANDVLTAEDAQLLPANWDVTSDAIATWIAIQLHASHLVFLKSVDRPNNASWQSIADHGHLDPFTPGLLARAPELVVDWVNLRRESVTTIDLPRTSRKDTEE